LNVDVGGRKDHVDRSCTLTLSDGSATQQVGKGTGSGRDYLFDYRIEGRLNALRGGGAPLLADREQSTVSYSMQLKVSQADFGSGNSRYEITGGPGYDINFVPDWRAMLTGSRD
jgi:hypothetical protein